MLSPAFLRPAFLLGFVLASLHPWASISQPVPAIDPKNGPPRQPVAEQPLPPLPPGPQWDGEYVCPGCDKTWELKTRCVVVKAGGAATPADAATCKGLPAPVNKYAKELCAFCWKPEPDDAPAGGGKPSTGNSATTTTTTGQAASGPATATGTGASGPGKVKPADGSKTRLRHRQLAPENDYGVYNPRYRGGADRGHFVVSYELHAMPDAPRAGLPIPNIGYRQCLHECWTRRGDARTSGSSVPLNRLSSVDTPTRDIQQCSWFFWTGGDETRGDCILYNRGKLPRPVSRRFRDAQGRPGGTVGFVAFPRGYELFREFTGVAPNEERRAFPTASGTFIVYSGSGEFEGQGTYCVGTQDIQTANQCVATPQTRLDQAFLFQKIALASQITDATTVTLSPNEFLIPRQLTLQSTGVPNAAHWQYTLDEFYRITQVRLAGQNAAIGPAQLGSRDPDSMSKFQNIHNIVMRRGNQQPPGQAGHLVPAHKRPPNLLFNYVPQNGVSNSFGGCWFHTELVSAIFMYLGCRISYDIDLTYPTDAQLPAAGAMQQGFSQRCHHRFRPRTMMLTWRIHRDGAGNTCANFVAHLPNQQQMQLIQGNQQGITTTRWIAYLILKDVNWKQGEDPRKIVPGQHAWDRLLDVATADTAVTQATGTAGCLNDNGHFSNFPSVRLLPNFAGAFLTTQGNQWCLQLSNPTTVQFTTNAQNCARWTRAANGNVGVGNACLPGAGGCAVLHYLNPRQAPDSATPDNTDVTRTGPQDRLYIENLVTAYVKTANGAQCLTKGSGAAPIAPVTWAAATPLTNCLKIRISYYPLGQLQ